MAHNIPCEKDFEDLEVFNQKELLALAAASLTSALE